MEGWICLDIDVESNVESASNLISHWSSALLYTAFLGLA